MTNSEIATPSTGLSRPYLPFLDGIRGFAALYVMIHHFMPLDVRGLPTLFKLLTAPFLFGHFMVGVFIVLSGFSLALPIAGDGQSKHLGFQRYIVRRAKRIMPPYYAALCLSVASLYLLSHFDTKIPPTKDFLDKFSWNDFSSYLFLVQNWKTHSIDINRALWSIASEWQIYFFFPLILLPLWRINAALMLGAALLLGLMPAMIFPYFNLEYTCPWYLFLFAIGMQGAFFFRSATFVNARFPSLFVGFGCFCALCYLLLKSIDSYYVMKPGIANLQWLKDISGGGIAWFLIMFCCSGRNGAALEPNSASNRAALYPLHRLLESPLAVWLGSFSYSLYLTHEIVLLYVRFVNANWILSPLSYFFFRLGVGMPLALGFALVFFRLFERPFLQRNLRQKAQVLPDPSRLTPRP